jgi:hypothetical protein
MGKADQYLKGEWNAICDYCGEKRKSNDLRLTWDNALVCADTCWEPRQPQDFVRGKIDRQRVPPHLSRPDDQDNFTETTLNGAVAKDALTIIVASAAGIAQYTSIAIETDEITQDASGITGDNVTASGRVLHQTFVASIAGTTVTLGERMPYAASSGLKVYILHDHRFLGTNEVTIANL